MVRGDTSAYAAFAADYHRHFRLAAEHIAVKRAIVHKLVHSDCDKIDIHKLAYGANAANSCAYTRADNRCFAYRRIDNPILAELVNHTLGCAVSSAVKTDVFTHDDNVFVAAHLFGLCGDKSLTHRLYLQTVFRFD